jgi:iodotyrosine deiodinase
MKQAKFISLDFKAISEADMLQRAKEFYELLKRRRSVREFSDKPVPKEILEQIATFI